MQVEVHCHVCSSWCSFCNGEFNLFSIVFPNFGHILDWRILLESAEDIDKKDLDKRVRALTTLTKDDEIPMLAADFFDSEHPMPVVRALFIHQLLIYLPSCILSLLCLQFFWLTLAQGH
jgi:hypothetical protein